MSIILRFLTIILICAKAKEVVAVIACRRNISPWLVYRECKTEVLVSVGDDEILVLLMASWFQAKALTYLEVLIGHPVKALKRRVWDKPIRRYLKAARQVFNRYRYFSTVKIRV
jgi:hypothetical protein